MKTRFLLYWIEKKIIYWGDYSRPFESEKYDLQKIAGCFTLSNAISIQETVFEKGRVNWNTATENVQTSFVLKFNSLGRNAPFLNSLRTSGGRERVHWEWVTKH